VKYLLENQKRGILGEKIAKDDYIENGFKIVSTKIGSDFIASKKIGEKLYREHVEVKTGKSKLSKLQKIVMKKAKGSGKTYTVYRVSEVFMENYLVSHPNISGISRSDNE
jgi:hypothetical protein